MKSLSPLNVQVWLLALVTLCLLLAIRLPASNSTSSSRDSTATASPRDRILQDASSSSYFPHRVASFDPSSHAVIIWTRVTVQDVAVEVSPLISWEMATDSEFNEPVASGTVTTSANHDYTVHIDVTGLEGYTFYYYRFQYCPSTTTATCEYSVTGRTKTAPSTGQVQQVRFASVSCASYQWGWFHAYDRLAEKDNVDAVINLGDYIYEQAPGEFGDVRVHDPPRATVSLEDYRTRYSQYRLEQGLQRLHQLQPFINTWDDHEFANDAWRDGSPAHDPATQGSYEDRKRAAAQAFMEWLPFRPMTTENNGITAVTSRTFPNTRQQQRANNDTTPYVFPIIYRKLRYGDLVDLFVLDNRIIGRDEQKPAFEGGQTMFLPSYYDPDHDLLGETQMDWIKRSLQQSDAKWKVVVQPILLSPISLFGLLAFSRDAWDGYQSDRAEFLDYIADNHIDNVVILTGDVHITVISDLPKEKTADLKTWADWLIRYPWIWLTDDYTSIAVEFVVTSVTSATNFEDSFINDIPFGREIVDFLVSTAGLSLNPHGKFVDTLNHGYQIIDLQPERVQADIYFTGTPREETDTRPREKQYQRSYFSLDGDNHVQISYDESSPLLDG